jgi:hypothetical protein
MYDMQCVTYTTVDKTAAINVYEGGATHSDKHMLWGYGLPSFSISVNKLGGLLRMCAYYMCWSQQPGYMFIRQPGVVHAIGQLWSHGSNVHNITSISVGEADSLWEIHILILWGRAGI